MGEIEFKEKEVIKQICKKAGFLYSEIYNIENTWKSEKIFYEIFFKQDGKRKIIRATVEYPTGYIEEIEEVKE